MPVRGGDDDGAIDLPATLQIGFGENIERTGNVQKLNAGNGKDGDGSGLHLTASCPQRNGFGRK